MSILKCYQKLIVYKSYRYICIYCIPGEKGDNNTCVLKIKFFHSKCYDGCVDGRERERWRATMIDTTWRQTYSEPSFLLLCQELWYSASSQPWNHLQLPPGWHVYLLTALWMTDCPWCNCYRRRKWTRWHEFKSWPRLIAFHIALIPLGKVWIQLFSLQLWVNSRTD